MVDATIRSLGTFLRASREKSQSEILKGFLYALIKNNTVAESGSILIYNHATGKLFLFNDDNFLFKQGFLQETDNWQQTFAPWDGIAGAAFAYGQLVNVKNVNEDPRYIQSGGPLPIRAMVCVPIRLSDRHPPFGVVSFHNDQPEEQFSDDQISLIEVYVETLVLALKASSRRLAMERDAKVFIVHGRDETALRELQLVLREANLVPVVLQNEAKTGPEILEKLEDEIGKCMAGFVLLTPDDEGRLRDSADALQPRARQNVIFEAGYLVAQFRGLGRVCFLLKKPMEMPSDLTGLLYEQFESIEGSRDRINRVLTEWKLLNPNTK